MLTRTISIRVRYAETDKMGVVYHGNYATYCEVARVELFRQIGLPYKELEDSGVMLPVTKLEFKFFKPAFYDELLTIETSVLQIPKSARIIFGYKIFNSAKELITEALSELAFVHIESGRPVRCPEKMRKRIESLF